jgi:pyruvate dehydrogenase kinase 2/3/4
MLEHIKSRHDPTVTTVAQGVLEWKRSQNARSIGLDIQAWLDRFYLSRIGIRFLIGQRASFNLIYSIFHFPCIIYIDVAINTQQAHQDYVGIICTQAVRSLPSTPPLTNPIQSPTERPRHSPRSNRKRPFCM